MYNSLTQVNDGKFCVHTTFGSPTVELNVLVEHKCRKKLIKKEREGEKRERGEMRTREGEEREERGREEGLKERWSVHSHESQTFKHDKTIPTEERIHM